MEKLHLKKGLDLGIVSPTTVLTGEDKLMEEDTEPEVARLQHTAQVKERRTVRSG